MIDVTLENFEAEVVAASMEVPVLVDFWAPWCGPCKTLGPLLDKMEEAYGGRFKLAKVDSDQEQQLAGMFGIRSIPTCVLMIGGRPVDGFMGAQGEGQLRAFLDKHLPSEAALDAESDVDEAHQLLESGDTGAALQKLADALAADPNNDDARFDYLRLLIATGGFEEAQALLREPLKRIPLPLRFDALSRWLDALQFVDGNERGNWPLEQFDALIAANRRDFEARFDKARVLVAEGQWTEAMDELLEIIMRDKTWNQDAARKLYVAVLELLTPPKPKAEANIPGKTAGGIELMGKSAQQEDETTAMLNSYRRKLSMALN
ncbi:tetratricopeptide repeat protein [Comamonas endophytica]|uniref:Tetratricopeptide repeat protein n=1 Tax=Comamonas endophytica TaxID=2949090 RepID=A0ABY6G5K7_9BURK|nr:MULTISPECIES: tetratricopeptide repeat protein [unclassified Acidovorax]MCD2512250.1 tetratricopeptide repeat protein [Acidovorax sp. D4N7]UYG50293.1 tetratricopeptide repeat protein [Acidovorax sp. 5MLIR]